MLSHISSLANVLAFHLLWTEVHRGTYGKRPSAELREVSSTRDVPESVGALEIEFSMLMQHFVHTQNLFQVTGMLRHSGISSVVVEKGTGLWWGLQPRASELRGCGRGAGGRNGTSGFPAALEADHSKRHSSNRIMGMFVVCHSIPPIPSIFWGTGIKAFSIYRLLASFFFFFLLSVGSLHINLILLIVH